MKKIKIPDIWSFDKFQGNFQKHIESSIPFYNIGHDLIIKYSKFILNNESVCCDIGCSTGELLRKLDNRYSKELNIKYLGIDDSKKMINLAKKNNNSKNIKFICGNFINNKIPNSDLIILYYTLQFIEKNNKKKILKKIYNNLNDSGSIIIFEKIYPETVKEFEIFNSLYYDFKISNRESASEILDKESSLRSVLKLSTKRELFTILRDVGFKKIIPLTKYLFFEGFIIYK